MGLDGETTDGLDSELVEDFHDDLTAQKTSRDGLSPKFFPLTSSEQTGYSFTLEGVESYRGREVYRLRFEPETKPGLGDIDDDLRIWEGEVLVDQQEFQPVFIATQMSEDSAAAAGAVWDQHPPTRIQRQLPAVR